MSRRVYVAGVGMTRFGELFDYGLSDLIGEAYRMALEDSALDPGRIQAAWFGSAGTGLFTVQDGSLPSFVSEACGLDLIPVSRVENACASGSDALRHAYESIRSGTLDCALAIGAEKMSDVQSPGRSLAIIGRGMDSETEYPIGATAASLYAMMAQRHMHEYGTTREQLALVSVKNHKFAVDNPNACLRMPVTLEKVLGSRRIASPLGLFDCCVNSDGGAAAILCSEEVAKKLPHTPVEVLASCLRTDSISLAGRRSLTSLASASSAAKAAYSQAGLGPGDVDVVEVHDCFTIAEILAYEDLGLCERGKGGKFVEEGGSDHGGSTPVNTSGGLKAKGHPTGATGLGQIYQLVKQLRGEAGRWQVGGAKVALNHNVAGTGGACVVTLLRSEA